MHEQSDTIDTCPAQAGDSLAQTLPQTQTHRFTFTGSGEEYFRIWIVNLFLTVATLGVYSAWAKVRRLQYFDRNTELAGAVFDFSGEPKTILKGRAVAVVLLAAYHYAFGFSLAIGLAIIGALLVALPYFLRSALRFRLHHTHYRGLRCDFGGSAGGAYRAYLPPLLTFLLPGAMMAATPRSGAAAAAFLLYLGWPLMHSGMKRYQQQHLLYGATASAYQVRARRFVKPYLLAMLVALAGAIALCVVIGFSMRLLPKSTASASEARAALWFLPALVGLGVTYAMYLLAGPYLQARVGNLVWSNTRFPGVEIRSQMAAWGLLKLQTANALLTLATLGLYRPFAVVRLYRFRLAALSLHTAGSIEQAVAGTTRGRPGAAGDGVADFLGIDLSW